MSVLALMKYHQIMIRLSPFLFLHYMPFFHLQVVLTVSQLIWCRDVTEILEGDFDRLEGMKEFEQKNFKVP